MPALHQFIQTTFSGELREAKQALMQKIKDTTPWLPQSEARTDDVLLTTPRMSGATQSAGWFTKPRPATFYDVTVLQLKEHDAAQALTRVDAQMMREIKRSEMLYQPFERIVQDLPTCSYVVYAERLKKFGNWIATQIVAETKPKLRVRVYCKWVLVAKHCVMLNNFSSTCAILAGLNHQAITRMSALLRAIPEDVRLLKQGMEENFMGFSDNYARSMIDDCIK